MMEAYWEQYTYDPHFSFTLQPKIRIVLLLFFLGVVGKNMEYIIAI